MPITLEYPSTLPLPTNRESSVQQAGTVQADAEAGIPKIFKWSDDAVVRFNLVWNFDQDQETAFIDFFFNDLDNGTRWFLMDLQWLVDKGGETRKLECNFNVEKPNYANSGKRRVVVATLLVRTPPRDDLTFYNAYLPLLDLDDDIADLLDALEIFSNIDMPGTIGP